MHLIEVEVAFSLQFITMLCTPQRFANKLPCQLGLQLYLSCQSYLAEPRIYAFLHRSHIVLWKGVYTKKYQLIEHTLGIDHFKLPIRICVCQIFSNSFQCLYYHSYKQAKDCEFSKKYITLEIHLVYRLPGSILFVIS